MSTSQTPSGGAFLVGEGKPEQTLLPEELSSEARLMAKTLEDFLRKEVLPLQERIEAREEGLMPRLIRQAGALGLLAGNIPERFGGLNLPKSSLALLTETMGVSPSFAISVGVHSGVATLPLLYFGTPEQKAKYLPKLASGEWIGAFALSEANSGSDALAAQTKATLSADGEHWELNGTKLWITNGGFADLLTVFAQADGNKFTAFVVERETPGVTAEREEHKLGLHGSSTRRVVFEKAKVPAESVVGDVGKGHRPALYALNVGRFHIGATALGFAKDVFRTAIQYAEQRVQFGRPIAQFPLIQHKIAEMATRLFVLESMIYRTAGYWDAVLETIDTDAPEAAERYRAASEEYAVECAMIKFVGTETLGCVVDEGLQIHGGFGFSEEFPMARAYRDARVFRIFEGTNEINRLTVVDQLLRRSRQGRLALNPAIAAVEESAAEDREHDAEFPADLVDAAGIMTHQLRAATLYTFGKALEVFGEEGLNAQQETAAALAEMIALLYGAESAWLRCRKLHQAGKLYASAHPQDEWAEAPPALLSTLLFAGDACEQTLRLARTIFTSFGSDRPPYADLDALQRLLRLPLLNTVALRRQLAGKNRE